MAPEKELSVENVVRAVRGAEWTELLVISEFLPGARYTAPLAQPMCYLGLHMQRYWQVMHEEWTLENRNVLKEPRTF